MRWHLRAVAAALVLAIGSCDSGVGPEVGDVSSILVETTAVTLTSLGATHQVTVAARDASGDPLLGVPLIWTSSKEAVATVSSSGLITARGNGSASISVRAGQATATISVTVAQAAITLALSVDSLILESLGDSARVGATLLDAGGSAVVGGVVEWSTTDEAVATVSSIGFVRAVHSGVTLLTARAGSLLETLPVRVSQRPDSIGVAVASIAFDALGDTTSVEATVYDAAGAAFEGAGVVWTSSDTMVARVSSTGVVTSTGNGTATVNASSDRASLDVLVRVQQLAVDVALQPDSVVFADIAQTVILTVVVEDRLGSPIAGAPRVWGSSDAAVATVSDGTVRSVGTGTAYIRVDAGGPIDSITARVLPELSLAPVAGDSVSAVVASTVPLSVRVADEQGGGFAGAMVTWAITDGGGAIASSAVTTSDQTGHASGLWALGTGAGAQHATATIQTRGDAVTVEFVADATADVPVTAFLLADSVLLSARGETAYLAPTFLDVHGNPALATSVSWRTTDPGVAIVAADGLVTGQAAGSAWARSSMGASTDSILVTVVPRGAITITFDDGWLTTYTNARVVMDELGLDGNVGVYTEAVGWPGYMGLSQLQDLHDDGWTMVSHTVSHDSLTTLSDAVLDFELRESRAWLIDRGFERGSHIFIAPYHDFTSRERLAVSTYYEAARGASANAFVPDSLVFWQPTNPYELTAIDVDQLPYTTVQGRANLRTMLARTLAEGRFLDVLFHQVPPENVDALRATLAIVDEFRERVLPYHELYPELARVVF